VTPPRVLLVGAGIRRLGEQPDDDADALVVEDSRIAWIGRSPAAPAVTRRIDVDGWITPAFVDAHVHATATGLAADGLDLAGATSLAEVLDRLRAHVHASVQDPVLGTRWDESAWPEQRPPTAQELRDAAPGRTVLLERVDSHSLVVDATTLARLDLDRCPEGDVVRDRTGAATGWLKEAAAAGARRQVHARLDRERLTAARSATCRRALSLGITSIHEMAHPGLSSLEDAKAWATGEWPVDVQVWWAELDADAAPRHGLRLGGDLFLDGSIGSRTAAVVTPYRDAGGTGQLFHDDAGVTAFFDAATRRGEGAGVHAIGDRAIEQALTALERVAQVHGRPAVRHCRHRFEHVELPAPGHADRMAALGIVASIQPAFDAEWGGSDRLYAQRFGAQAALRTNPVAELVAAGVPLAFGSDSTVTPMDPWAGVVAAERHRGGLGTDRRTAWRASTLGGRFVAGQDDVGPVVVGARADLAVWDADPLAVDDPRHLGCLSTIREGRQVYGE
jgi:predicted amidohydrolase YtcJ